MDKKNVSSVMPVAHDYATYMVSVDYSRTLGDMIAAGKYDLFNNNIVEENFPIQRTPDVQNGDSEIVLVHLNKGGHNTDKILRHMDVLGLRSGRIEHLLALGEKHPNLQMDFSIIAPGSVWVDSDGRRLVPYLGRVVSARYLHLRRWFDPDVEWYHHCCFLAVSK